MNIFIRSDLFRYKGSARNRDFIICYLTNATFRWQVAFRLVSSPNVLERVVGYALWALNRNHQNIQISHRTKIWKGLYIGHNGPVVVNPTAVIGNNCNLSQFVTIGSNENSAAVIGDNVYIGPSTCVVENVHIGNNVTIGAGSVVTKDIPDNATAAGNYAKVLNYHSPARYIQNIWKE